jgi:hypothetical protein
MLSIMNLDLPTVAELKQAAESGQRISAQDVSAISQVENRLTGRGPVRGGPAGMLFLESTKISRWLLIGR